MSIIVHSKTKVSLSLESDIDTDRYLRVKYLGKRSERFSDLFKISVRKPIPKQPTITLDRTEITPGSGIIATGSDFLSYFASDTHLSTDWRVSTDPEGNEVVAITGIPNSLTSAVIDNFIDQPAGDYYISTRYEGIYGFSDWAEPVKISWITYNIPDEYWEKQEAAFTTIKAVAEECRDANTFVSNMLTSMRNLRWNTFFHDSPVGKNTIQLGLSAVDGSVNSNTLYMDATGQVYGDTFIATITDPKLFAGHKKGHFRYSSNYPIQIFDLEKSHGKFVVSYETGSYKLWFAYEGDSFNTGGKFYVVPKESPLRPDIGVELLTLPYWDPI